MTLNEFKAWLDGFEEAMIDGYPTTDQWEKIRTKINEIKIHTGSLQATPLPITVPEDSLYPKKKPYYPSYPFPRD
jgi:hypothetical protein